jgi:hypothetical protein
MKQISFRGEHWKRMEQFEWWGKWEEWLLRNICGMKICIYVWSLALNLHNLCNELEQLCICDSFLKNLGISILKYNNPVSISIEPGQTAWMCRLAWLYTNGKGIWFQQVKGTCKSSVWKSLNKKIIKMMTNIFLAD